MSTEKPEESHRSEVSRRQFLGASAAAGVAAITPTAGCSTTSAEQVEGNSEDSQEWGKYLLYREGPYSKVLDADTDEVLYRSKDTGALLNRLDADHKYPAENEQLLLVKRDEYLFETTWEPNVSWTVWGETYRTVWKLADGANTDLVHMEQTDGNTWGFANFEALRLDGNKDAQAADDESAVVRIGDSVSDVTLRDVFVKNATGHNIVVEETGRGSRAPWNIHLQNVWSEWAAKRPLLVRGTGEHNWGLYGLVVENCNLGDNPLGARIEGLTTRAEQACNIFAGNKLYSIHDAPGLELAGVEDLVVDANPISGTGGPGVTLESLDRQRLDNVAFTGNNIRYVDGAAAEVQNEVGHVVASGNVAPAGWANKDRIESLSSGDLAP